jgi:hypothetical protein
MFEVDGDLQHHSVSTLVAAFLHTPQYKEVGRTNFKRSKSRMSGLPPRIFLLSPARLDGKRAHFLFHPATMFPVARALRSSRGAPIGEVFTFLSGLYFRGKLAYAAAFARPLRGISSGVFVITPNRGLLAPSVRVTLNDLADLAKTEIDPCTEKFRKPLREDAEALAEALGPRGEPVLLGSIATTKYSDVLLSAFSQELLFPAEFVGRGDMSRGGLLLRSVDAHLELSYVPVRGAVLRGARPPKLPPRSTLSLGTRQRTR